MWEPSETKKNSKRNLFLSPLAREIILILTLSHTFLMLLFINKIQLLFKCLVTHWVFLCSSGAIISFRLSSYSSLKNECFYSSAIFHIYPRK